MKAILATGLSGLVGSRFQELFGDQFDFTNLDLATNIDITNKTQIDQAIGQSRAETLVHFAAFTNVDAAHLQNGDKKGSCYQINVLGTHNVAQSCKTHDKYLIHISTDFVFDGKKQGLYTETDLPNPIEWYGLTKYLAEQEVAKSAAQACIVRLTYPYRAYHPTRLDIVRSILAKLKDNTLPPMFTDHIITPTFIDDIARALAAIIDQRPSGTFHVVGSTPLSDYDLACQIAREFGFDQSKIQKGSLKEFLKTAKRPYQIRLADSNQKLKAELGISMSTIEEGLRQLKQQIRSSLPGPR